MKLLKRFWHWWYRVCPECGKYVPYSNDNTNATLNMMDWCKHKQQRHDERKKRRLSA
jgi:hypothetical protein